MHYGKIVNGKLESAPIEIYTEDGKVIELNTREDYINNGYKVVINKKPSYNNNQFELHIVDFLETEFTITINYELIEKEKTENDNNILEEFITIYNEEINNK